MDASNDDVFRIQSALKGSDSYGQAAMLLVESLMHSLIAKSALSLEEAIEAVDLAAKVATELARDGAIVVQNPSALLTTIGVSLRQDLPRSASHLAPAPDPDPKLNRPKLSQSAGVEETD